MKEIRHILIANRGEIAVRVAQACRKMGIQSTLAYADDDPQLRAREFVTRSVRLESRNRMAFLDKAALIETCKTVCADAIHPGYGFLSENPDFSEKLQNAGIKFIGPTSEVLRLFGDKIKTKVLARQLGIPLLGEIQVPNSDISNSELKSLEGSLIYPCLIKAATGGGGRGMRVARDSTEFSQALREVGREIANGFEAGSILVEPYLSQVRHIEIQVMADVHQEVRAVGDRDCTIQRRRQKIIEEGPAQLSNELRQKLYFESETLVKASGLVGVATVEFLLDSKGQQYFMEVNPRLQVEHTITEALTGLDLVEWQIRLARGEALDLKAKSCQQTGHAIQIRINAEDPELGFAPDSGFIRSFSLPELKGVRWDHGLYEHQPVLDHYDNLLAKLIVHAADRDQTVKVASTLLKDTVILGVKSNKHFLSDLLLKMEFRDRKIWTSTLDEKSELFNSKNLSADHYFEMALGILVAENDLELNSAWSEKTLFGQTQYRQCVSFGAESKIMTYELHRDDAHLVIRILDPIHLKREIKIGDIKRIGNSLKILWLETSGNTYMVPYWLAGSELILEISGQSQRVSFESTTRSIRSSDQPEICSPMAGVIKSVEVQAGDYLTEGQTVFVIEAMKMEVAVKAQASGKLIRFQLSLGQRIQAHTPVGFIERIS